MKVDEPWTRLHEPRCPFLAKRLASEVSRVDLASRVADSPIVMGFALVGSCPVHPHRLQLSDIARLIFALVRHGFESILHLILNLNHNMRSRTTSAISELGCSHRSYLVDHPTLLPMSTWRLDRAAYLVEHVDDNDGSAVTRTVISGHTRCTTGIHAP